MVFLPLVTSVPSISNFFLRLQNLWGKVLFVKRMRAHMVPYFFPETCRKKFIYHYVVPMGLQVGIVIKIGFYITYQPVLLLLYLCNFRLKVLY